MKLNIKGFTLIELMIAVAIIGILAAIAYPSYQNSIKKTHRSDAKASLQSFAAAMERKFTENNSYCDNADATGTAVTNCGGTGKDSGTPDFFATTVPVDGGNIMYDLTIDSVSPTQFTLKATRRTGSMMDGDECGNFQISSTGVRSIDVLNATDALKAKCL